MINNYIIKCSLLVLMLTFSSLTASTVAAQEFRTVTDGIGRKVILPLEIKNVAAIDSFAAEVMLMIGAGDYLKACPNGVKSNVLLQRLYPNLKNVQAFHGSGNFNAEALMELNVDILLSKHDFFTKETQIKKLEALNIPIIAICYNDMESQLRALKLIGGMFDETSKAKAEYIADYYQHIVEMVTERAATIPEAEKKRVYHAVNAFNFTSGYNLGSSWIAEAGCINVAHGDNDSASDHSINIEYIFMWQPDAIICNEALTAAKFKTDDRLKHLNAVEHGQVFSVPVGITRWGHPVSLEKFFAMLWLAINLYPEYYTDIDLKTEVVNFYGSLGIEINEELYASIIKGEGLRLPRKNN